MSENNYKKKLARTMINESPQKTSNQKSPVANQRNKAKVNDCVKYSVEIKSLKKKNQDLESEVSRLKELVKVMKYRRYEARDALEYLYLETIKKASKKLKNLLGEKRIVDEDMEGNVLQNFEGLLDQVGERMNEQKMYLGQSSKKLKVSQHDNAQQKARKEEEQVINQSVQDIDIQIEEGSSSQLSELGEIVTTPPEIDNVQSIVKESKETQTEDFDQSQPNEEVKKDISEMIHPSVDCFANHYCEGNFGGSETIIAAKDENSYLLLTKQKGLKIIESGTVVYRIPRGSITFSIPWPLSRRKKRNVYENIIFAIYIKEINRYIIWTKSAILRKRSDSSEPSLLFKSDQDLSYGYGSLEYNPLFEYCLHHNKLVVLSGYEKKLFSLNTIKYNEKAENMIERNYLEVEAHRSCDEKNPIGLAMQTAVNFKLIGPNQDYAVLFCEGRQLNLIKLDYEKDVAEFTQRLEVQPCDQTDTDRENGHNLSVASYEQEDLIFVELVENLSGHKRTTRIVVYTVKHESLFMKTQLIFFNNAKFYALKKFVVYPQIVDDNLLLFGVSEPPEGSSMRIFGNPWGKEWQEKVEDMGPTGMFFSYDLKKDKLKELKEKTVDLEEKNVAKVDLIGNNFYYTGKGAKFMRLSLSLDKE